MTTDREEFETWARGIEPRLRTALSARLGPQRGSEATAEALVYAWSHFGRVRRMHHPLGYLFKVGQSRTRVRRRTRVLHDVRDFSEPMIEPELQAVLEGLTDSQRVCVVLVCGFDWQLGEVAELLGVAVTTVQTHVDRALAKLRAGLKVSYV